MNATEHAAQRPTKIAIVGAGNVGSTFAYALMLSGPASEIVLVDADHARAEGEAMDLSHALPFAPPTRVYAGAFSDCAGAAVTVVTAGAAQKPGETRLDLVKKNAAIFEQIIPAVVDPATDGVLLIATNPVDVLTYVALQIAGLPARRVIGSGSILDTARFRYNLGRHCGVDSHSVHGYIIGEHGDSEVPVWSLANIGGLSLTDFCAAQGPAYDDATRAAVLAETRDAAYHIINRKGATYYAVASGLLRIVAAIVRDQHTVLSVSSLINDCYGINDVCLSLPTIVNRSGIEQVLQLQLADAELAALRHSAGVLRESISDLALAKR